MNGLIIQDRDNVAVVIEPVKKGDKVQYSLSDRSVCEIVALEDIPVYHKIAVRPIRRGEKIVKYGEHIGEASRDIRAGEHVHVHNVDSVREDLEHARIS